MFKPTSKDILMNFEYVNSQMKKSWPSLPNHVSRNNAIRHAQFRVERRKLNSIYSLQVMDSPAYSCGNDCEDSYHYLLQCPLFYQARNMIITEIRKLTMTDFDVICCCMGHKYAAELSISIH